jgi:hypothetical protein
MILRINAVYTVKYAVKQNTGQKASDIRLSVPGAAAKGCRYAVIGTGHRILRMKNDI